VGVPLRTDVRTGVTTDAVVVETEAEGAPKMRKIFNLTTVASGLAIGMILAGVLAVIGGAYAKDVVHDQLAPQKIFFSEDASKLPENLKPYAGEQVDTAKEAKLFAEDYIGLHLQETAGGQTYSEVSGQFMADPENQELAQQRQTLFMGETLRGMLLSAWGWGTVGTVATIAGISLIGIGGILLAIPLAALVTSRRRDAAPRATEASAAV
jgi:hypothetical protein